MANEFYTFEQTGYYPHMNFRDVDIWERFIDRYAGMYESCQYDFHVGDGPPFNTLMDDDTDTNQDKLYRLRIDVLGHTPERVDVIEVKPNAGVSAIGQLESYKNLYVRDFEPKKKVGMVLVTDSMKPNMEFLCREKGIKLFIV